MSWEAPEPPPRRTARRRTAVLVGLVAVLLGALTLAGGAGGAGDTDGAGRGAAETAAEDRGLTVTTVAPGQAELPAAPGAAPGAPDPAVMVTEPRPVLPGRADLRVAALVRRPGSSTSGSIQTLDLRTGVRHSRGLGIDTAGGHQLVAGPDGIHVADRPRLTRYPWDLGDVRTLVEDGVLAVHRAGAPGSVWVVASRPQPSVLRIGADGRERRTLPEGARSVGTVGDTVVVGLVDRVVRLGADATSGLAAGRLVATSTDAALVLRCGATGCGLVRVDASGGTGGTVTPLPAGLGVEPPGGPERSGGERDEADREGDAVPDTSTDASLSPDGRTLLYTELAGTRLRGIDLDTATRLELPDTGHLGSIRAYAWTPDARAVALGSSTGVHWLDLPTATVTRLPMVGDVVDLAVTPVPDGGG